MGALRAVEAGEEADVEAVTFEDFWVLYPRHAAKKDAKKMWARIPEGLHVTILTALVAWRQVWRDKDTEFLPHPATWLNGERWEDELPLGYRLMPASAPRPEPTEPTERTPIPAHVKALMAKLRSRP